MLVLYHPPKRYQNIELNQPICNQDYKINPRYYQLLIDTERNGFYYAVMALSLLGYKSAYQTRLSLADRGHTLEITLC